MIRFLLFELEKTLVDNQGKILAHALDGLETLKGFRTDTGEAPLMCLISVGSASPSGVYETFDGLVSRLETLGLRRFFDPVEQRVTLMAHADGGEFDRRLFEIAVTRSASDATLDQCLFVTGDHDVARLAMSVDVRTLEFSPNQDRGIGFVDWVEAPLLVAKIVGSNRQKNTEAALRLYLAATENMDLVSLAPTADPHTLLGKVSAWHAIKSEKLGDLSGLNVKLPTEIRVQLYSSGKVKTVDRTEPAPTDKEEAAHFVESLVTHGQIASESEVPPRGATHQINTDSEGRRYLVRKRFAAV